MAVSVLFNEPKLLKFSAFALAFVHPDGFSALQRAEIAEMPASEIAAAARIACFSALQRAEIAEMVHAAFVALVPRRFSALQRAEIAEIFASLLIPRAGALFQCSSTSRNC